MGVGRGTGLAGRVRLDVRADLPRWRRRDEPPEVVPYPISTLPEDSSELSSAASSAEGWVPARSSSR